jgi:hypothetical protein
MGYEPVIPLKNLAGWLLAFVLCASPGTRAYAQQAASPPPANAGLGQLQPHQHDPIIVRSRPVIERLPVKVISPVDLRVSKAGHVFIADDEANCIFRLDEFSAVSLVAENLPDLRRISLDADGSLYVLTSTAGEAGLYQITPEGRRFLLQTLHFPTSAFARNAVGEFVLASERRLLRLNTDGEIIPLAELTEPVLDLAANPAGGTEVLVSGGRVLSLDAVGTLRPTGFGHSQSQRLLSRPDGRQVTLSAADALSPDRTGLFEVLDQRPADGQVPSVAFVPEGTRAAGFDSLGNLLLANPDLRAITRVTSRFQIPCPHCRQSTLMIFDAEARPDRSGSF